MAKNLYAALDACHDEWRQVVLRTGVADHAVVESAIREIYKLCYEEAPGQFVWVQSPRLAVEYLAQHEGVSVEHYDFPWRFVRGMDSDDIVHERLRAPLQCLVDSTQGIIDVALDYWAEGRLWNQMGESAAEAAKEVFDRRTSTILGHGLLTRLTTELRDTFQRVLNYSLDHAAVVLRDRGMSGSGDAPWIAYQLYMHEHIKPIDDIVFPDHVAVLRQLEIVARQAGWWYPSESVCVISERPVAIHIDDAGRLHSPDEATPALAFADGWEIFMEHGELIAASPGTMKMRALHMVQWQQDVEDEIWERENDE